MDLSSLSVEQLKALGFDLVNTISNAQQSLQAVQMELQKRAVEEQKKEKK